MCYNLNLKGRNNMKLAIFGSRSLNDKRVKEIILDEIKQKGITEIVVAGEPRGVCAVARELCREIGLPLKVYFLDRSKARGAWHHRSVSIIKDSDTALLIHDGKSKGTANELKLVKKYNMSYRYEVLEPVFGFNFEYDFDEDVDYGKF